MDSGLHKSTHIYQSIAINPSRSDPHSTVTRSYSRVNKLKLGYNNEQIYAMTPSTVVRVPVFDCPQFSTCKACLSSNDPYCGWCTLEAK